MEPVRYFVFQPFQAGAPGRACVVANFGDALESAEVELEGISGEITIAAPFQADHKVSLPVRITTPPRQLAVMVKS